MADKTGNYAFLFGVLVAILAAFGKMAPQKYGLILIVLGVIVGFLNVSKRETTNFLLASLVLMVAGAASGIVAQLPGIGILLAKVLLNITLFAAFAALIVALKTIYETAGR